LHVAKAIMRDEEFVNNDENEKERETKSLTSLLANGFLCGVVKLV